MVHSFLLSEAIEIRRVIRIRLPPIAKTRSKTAGGNQCLLQVLYLKLCKARYTKGYTIRLEKATVSKRIVTSMDKAHAMIACRIGWAGVGLMAEDRR